MYIAFSTIEQVKPQQPVASTYFIPVVTSKLRRKSKSIMGAHMRKPVCKGNLQHNFTPQSTALNIQKMAFTTECHLG